MVLARSSTAAARSRCTNMPAHPIATEAVAVITKTIKVTINTTVPIPMQSPLALRVELPKGLMKRNERGGRGCPQRRPAPRCEAPIPLPTQSRITITAFFSPALASWYRRCSGHSGASVTHARIAGCP